MALASLETMSCATNKGGSCQSENSCKNWIQSHRQGQKYGQGQCRGKLEVHGQEAVYG